MPLKLSHFGWFLLLLSKTAKCYYSQHFKIRVCCPYYAGLPYVCSKLIIYLLKSWARNMVRRAPWVERAQLEREEKKRIWEDSFHHQSLYINIKWIIHIKFLFFYDFRGPWTFWIVFSYSCWIVFELLDNLKSNTGHKCLLLVYYFLNQK